MPEGPEILYLSKLCENYVLNKTLIGIDTVDHTHSIKIPHESKIKRIMTKGKLLIFVMDTYYVHIHFGLDGWLLFDDPKYPRYKFTFKNSRDMYLDDSRKFSRIKIVKTVEENDKILDKLGIDIMTEDFTFDYFKEQITSRSKSILALLMDQTCFAGIGNYIKNESLYLAKIHPKRKSSSLTNKEIKDLYNAIKYVAFSNFVDEMKTSKLHVDKFYESIKIEVPYKFKVYGKTIDPKGNKVIKDTIGGRGCYYVKEIQK